MAKVKNGNAIKNGNVDEENGTVTYEKEQEFEKVKTLELMKVVGRMNRFWMKGGCTNNDIMAEVQELMQLFQRYSSASKNAVLSAIERVVRLGNAGGTELKEIASAATTLLAHAQKVCGSGVSDEQMRNALNAAAKKYPMLKDM